MHPESDDPKSDNTLLASGQKPKIDRHSINKLRFKESFAEMNENNKSNALTNRTHMSSTIADVINLPNFLITLEEFQSLNLPLINNFRVQQGTQNDKLKKSQSAKISAKHLLLHDKLDRKFMFAIVVLIVFVVFLIVTVLLLVIFKITSN